MKKTDDSVLRDTAEPRNKLVKVIEEQEQHNYRGNKNKKEIIFITTNSPKMFYKKTNIHRHPLHPRTLVLSHMHTKPLALIA